jgi:hypothetical protein
MSRKKQEIPAGETRTCSVSGCAEPGAYPAPRARDQLRNYQWLCLEHVREFNRSWDYFEGMSGAEIENFMQDSLTGHRPTWEREDSIRRTSYKYLDALEEGLTRFFGWDKDQIRRAEFERLPTRERKALAVLDLEDRVTLVELKGHYRRLVKLHHPDLHGGSSKHEEHFKKINAAYTYLVQLYQGK